MAVPATARTPCADVAPGTYVDNRLIYPADDELRRAFDVLKRAKIPNIPEIVNQLRAELAKEYPDAAAIAELISADPALAARLLMQANSALFGGRVEIINVKQAVIRMGLARVANLVTAELLASTIPHDQSSIAPIWEAINEEARAAVAIARLVDDISEDEAYLLGLLHDVGPLLFASLEPAYLEQFDAQLTTPDSIIQWEQKHFGVDHTAIGFLLARHWQMPDDFALAVFHHHSGVCACFDDSRVRGLTALIKLANFLVSQPVRSNQGKTSDIEPARRELMIEDSDWAQLQQDALLGFR